MLGGDVVGWPVGGLPRCGSGVRCGGVRCRGSRARRRPAEGGLGRQGIRCRPAGGFRCRGGPYRRQIRTGRCRAVASAVLAAAAAGDGLVGWSSGCQVLQLPQVPLYQAGAPSLLEEGARRAVPAAAVVAWFRCWVCHDRVLCGVGRIESACRVDEVIARCDRAVARKHDGAGNKGVSTGTGRGSLGQLAARPVRRADLGRRGEGGPPPSTVGTPVTAAERRCGADHVPRARRARPRTTSSLVAPPAGLEPAT